MNGRLKPVAQQTIVITGASSGIGLTTAELAAERGARVVLCARNSDALREVTDAILARGGHATYVVADVSQPDDMERVAEHAIAQFGSIDTWVNNAGVAMYGKLTEIPLEDKRRLFDIDFWGVVHGCRAAVPRLREHGGAIINVGSVVSDRAVPLLGIYCAAKHAVKGYTDTLRMELEKDGLPIAVTLVKPASIDTPLPEHAANYMEREPALTPPVYAPGEVARAILKCAERPVREITVGGGGAMLSALGFFAPRLMDLYMETMLFAQQQKDEPARGDDNLDQAGDDGRRRGGHEGIVMRRSAYTRAMLSDVGRALPLIAVGAAIAAGVAAIRRER